MIHLSYLNIISFDDCSWIQVVLQMNVRFLSQSLGPVSIGRWRYRNLSIITVYFIGEIDSLRVGLVTNCPMILLWVEKIKL